MSLLSRQFRFQPFFLVSFPFDPAFCHIAVTFLSLNTAVPINLMAMLCPK